MSAQTPVRSIDGVELPAPGSLKVRPGPCRDRFRRPPLHADRGARPVYRVDATIEIVEAPEDSRVEATIDMASVASGDNTRDDHLRSPDFFHVSKWPTATFRFTSLTWSGRVAP